VTDQVGGRFGSALESLAGGTSRRGFLSKVSGALVGGAAAGVVSKAVKPGDAEAYHFCGHIFTTGSCVHPTPGNPRIDGRGYPLHDDGQPMDNLGRRVNGSGEPVDSGGRVLRDPDGRPLPPAPRSKVCEETGKRYGIGTQIDGSWYRCCGGKVRKLVDCCSQSDRRINGDQALKGYCFAGRKVFCVMYFQTKVPC